MTNIIEDALAYMESQFKRGEAFTSPYIACNYFRLRLGLREREVFSCAFLDSRHRVIVTEDLFSGTIDGASVHPREVVKAALACNAAACIISHNHPSGVPEPSRADEILTRRIKEALALVDVRLLDHIIVTCEGHVSMAERGLL